MGIPPAVLDIGDHVADKNHPDKMTSTSCVEEGLNP
jgi:hypothetical protein